MVRSHALGTLRDLVLADVDQHHAHRRAASPKDSPCSGRRGAGRRPKFFEHRALGNTMLDDPAEADRARDPRGRASVRARRHRGFGITIIEAQVIGTYGGADVDDPVLFSSSGALGAESHSKILWKRPSDIFMMLSLVKHVTFFRLNWRVCSERIADDLLGAGARDEPLSDSISSVRGLILDAQRTDPSSFSHAAVTRVHHRVSGSDERIIRTARATIFA